jgi:hypothetical protein
MSIFDTLDYKIAHPLRDVEKVKEVHEKIESLLEKERPNAEDFRGIIPDDQIDKDIKDVLEAEARWEQKNTEEQKDIKRKADIAEYIIYKNLGTWMNQKAVPLLTAKPDDYLRGVDLIIESEQSVNNEKGDIDHLGVGIDVALTSEKGMSEALEKKEKKVRQILKSGKLNEARYVSGGSYEGRIENLSYIILSVTPSHIEDLFSSVLKNHSTQKEEAHILKYVVAYQITRQLRTYCEVAHGLGKNNLAREYAVANNFAYECFNHLIDDLAKDEVLTKKVMQDVGVQEIERFLEELRGLLT